jgi:predicted AlkP superfamily phosphohydrolase/phosphomutase
MKAAGPVLIVGFDACDCATARALAASGAMPVLRGLLATWARSDLRLPPGLFVSGLWPSFATGSRPDRHNLHCWDEIDVASYRRQLTTPRCVTAPPFWRRLAAAGRATASIDVPHGVVQDGAGGLEIAEWGCHDRHLGLQVSPAEERPRLEGAFGLHPVFGIERDTAARSFAPDDYIHRAGPTRTPTEEKRLIEGLLVGLATKARLSETYLTSRNWDLFITVFGESHAVGHQQWHLHDPQHPRFDQATLAFVGGDPIRRVYADLDAALGRLLARVDERTTVLVMLSHGMGPHHDGTHLLDEVLRRIDLADRIAAGEDRWSDAARRTYRALRRSLRHAALNLVRRNFRFWAAPLREFVSPAERAEQRFFLEPNNYVYGGVRFNRRGREPRGRVTPEALARVSASLEQDLLALVNVETGGPVIRGVDRAERWYRRTDGDTIPDLFLDWERTAPIESVWSAKTGLVHGPYRNWRTGDHRPHGLLLAAGPDIAPGRELGETAIEDLPASLMARFGEDCADMDGRPKDWLTGGNQAE